MLARNHVLGIGKVLLSLLDIGLGLRRITRQSFLELFASVYRPNVSTIMRLLDLGKRIPVKILFTYDFDYLFYLQVFVLEQLADLVLDLKSYLSIGRQHE